MPGAPIPPAASGRLHHPPPVHLGTLAEGGLAPAILAVVERGVRHRPALAAAFEAEIELALDEAVAPVRIVFAGSSVLVEDGPSEAPDLRIAGTLSSRGLGSNEAVKRALAETGGNACDSEEQSVRAQALSVVMVPYVHQFLGAGHAVDRHIVIAPVFQNHQSAVNFS